MIRGVELWSWIVVACVTCAVLLGLRRRADDDADALADDVLADDALADDEPAAVPAVPPTRWTPYEYPMGPVSGWPHLVDRPEAVPTGSPADRSFVD